ncbi:MAG: UDP-N-acetylglucosamine 2-epimerase (non-hydrolyzing) [Myxococcales bacterium]|nr:UDP-N-acetylglucosamine 2-epimerase (non-hydrolyzing) [Myxococcales bacterium]
MPAAKVAVFIGTRPEAIKMAPVIRALSEADDFTPVVISTGQHREMLQQVIDLFEIKTDLELDVMRPNQTLAGLTSRLITECDSALAQVEPDMAMVQGDTTTVMAAALCSFYRGIAVGHVEAGLRTGNLRAPFPEEANRVLAGRLTTLHFPPTPRAQQNLEREGVEVGQILVTGNTVIDALHMEVARQERPAVRAQIDESLRGLIGADWRSRPNVLITGHRRESFGAGFEAICGALGTLAERFPDHRFIYPVHLNPNVKGPVYATLGNRDNILLVPPQAYQEFVALMHASTVVLTDSGGVQEEAPGLGKPVLVMRETTERPEGVEAGTVKLVGTDQARIVDEVSRLFTDEAAYNDMARAENPYGDGKAAPRIVERLRAYLASRAPRSQPQ